jgi:hypothetical protein
MTTLVVVILAVVGLKFLIGRRWGPDRRFQLAPGWTTGRFEAASRPHPDGVFAIRFVRAERRDELDRGPPAVGVWNTETGQLIHLLSDSGSADARWTEDGRHLIVAREEPDVESGKEDVEVTVYTWPALAIASERRLGMETGGDDSWLQLTLSDGHGAVMRVFPEFCQQVAVFTQPIVQRVGLLHVEDALPLGPVALSPDDRCAAFLVMHWWSSDHEGLARRTSEALTWATLHLVHLRERRCSQHPVLVRPPAQWQPGEELEEAAFRLALGPNSLRFEGPAAPVFDLPWGGVGRVAMPPPPGAIWAPAPAAPGAGAVAV